MNTAPGENQSELAPGGPFQFSARGTVEDILLSTIEASVGSTDLLFHGGLPETEPAPLVVELHAAERAHPEGEPIDIAVSNGAITFSRTDGDQFRPCVYELSAPIDNDASVLAYVKFRKKAWTSFSPDWCYRDGIVGMYFGLRHGIYNTSCCTFLRTGGEEGMLVGGPLQSYRGPRPGESSYAWEWTGASDDSIIELYIHFNARGMSAPTYPPDYPMVDVWVVLNGAMERIARIPVGLLGTDPTRQQEGFATLFFGNSGQAGDVLEVLDWRIFQDFRMAIDRGDAHSDHAVSILADLPVSYLASSSKAPDAVAASGWSRSVSTNTVVKDSFGFQPGKLATAQTYRLAKSGNGHAAFYRKEPVLGAEAEGFMLEGFIASSVAGTGIEVEDGTSLFRVAAMDTADGQRTYGLQRGDDSFEALGDNDYSSLKLVRILGDRQNGALQVFINDEKVRSVPLNGSFPAASGTPRVGIGHLLDVDTSGRFDLAKVSCFQRLQLYDAAYGALPKDSPNLFTTNASGGTDSVADGVYRIDKTAFATPASFVTNFYPYPFREEQGGFVEFRVRVPEYTDSAGEKLSKKLFTGVGVRLYFTTRVLDIGFYDAGVHGRVVGVLPGSGTRQDLIDHTALGETHSAVVDWTGWQTYRVHFVPKKSIDLWVGSVASEPILSIPWGGGIDLPNLEPMLQGIEFGHFSGEESSVSEWEFVRFGRSSGWDVSVQQSYAISPRAEQFSGKSFMLVSFGDGVEMLSTMDAFVSEDGDYFVTAASEHFVHQ